jgi:hypothetical protein
MDIASLIAIIIAIVAIYFFIKLVVSPIIKAILGVVIFLVLIYILQRLGFNLDNILAPFGISLNLNRWAPNLSWLFGPANYYIDQLKTFLNYIWGNFPKGLSK